MLITYQDHDYRITASGAVYHIGRATETRMIDEEFIAGLRIEAARQAWRRAAERGYGTRDNSRAHMESVDARIRKLRDTYQSMLRRES